MERQREQEDRQKGEKAIEKMDRQGGMWRGGCGGAGGEERRASEQEGDGQRKRRWGRGQKERERWSEKETVGQRTEREREMDRERDGGAEDRTRGRWADKARKDDGWGQSESLQL